MKNLKKHKLAVFLITATLLGVICIGIYGGEKRAASTTERIGGDGASVPQGWISSVGNFFGGIGDYFGSNKKLREENERLKNENTNLQKQINDNAGMQDENDELRQMLDLKKTQVDLTLIAASVSAKDPSGWYSTFTIDKGISDGIKEDQPVVNSNRELIGRIGRTGDNWAEVVTLLDPQASIGAMVKRSGAIGILEGNTELRYSNKSRFGYLSRDTDITTGDYLETSGQGGIYPKGLIIGKIEEVKDDSSTMSRYAEVSICADVSSVKEVFVISAFKTSDLSDSEVTTEESKLKSKNKSDNKDNDEDAKDSDSTGSNKNGKSSTSSTSSKSSTSNKNSKSSSDDED